MALSVTELIGTNGSTQNWTSASFSCAAGDLLIVGFTRSSVSGGQQITGCTDDSGSGSWTLISDMGSGPHDAAWWYKEANGSETTVTVSQSATSAYDAFVVKVTGWAGTPTLEDSDEDESNTVTAATSTIGSGSVTNATANAIVFMFVTIDSPNTAGGGRSVSDGASYTEISDGDGADEQIFLYYREVSSTGTYSPVYSFVDTGEQGYGASAVFGDVVAAPPFNPLFARRRVERTQVRM